MPEHPALKLTRILGGVALLQGRLGHQVLGQLLIFNATDLEVAGANVLVAATAQHPNAVVQALVRVAAPAAALRALNRRQENQLTKLEQRLDERQAALAAREAASAGRDGASARREDAGARSLSREIRRASRELAALRAKHPEAASELDAIDARLTRARRAADAHTGPPPGPPLPLAPLPIPRRRRRGRGVT